EATQLRARRIAAAAEKDHARRLGLGHQRLQPAGTTHAVGRELSHALRDRGDRSSDRVVVVRLNLEAARRLGSAKAGGMGHAEDDRHLAEYLARAALAQHAFRAVDKPDRLETALEDTEQRPVVALVTYVLARLDRDVGDVAAEPLAVARLDA